MIKGVNDFRQKLRNIIHKCPPLYKICLLFIRDGGKLYYKTLDKKKNYSSVIKALHNTKDGKRCFIVGNGPSLTTDDLDKLVGEDCFAANKIYKIFPNTLWRPKYYMVLDWSGLEEDAQDCLDDMEIAFLGDHFYRLHKIEDKKNIVVVYGNRLLNTNLESFKFSEDISKGLYAGATVTYGILQLAVYMGYKEIYLLGIDHNYAYIADSKGNIIKNPNVDVSHFFKEDAKNAYADIVGMNNAFIAAKQYADEHGIKIFNATRGGALELFPRIQFDDLFGGNK